jgi:NhaP-type Na+/H+ or K+/H+ antiporter
VLTTTGFILGANVLGVLRIRIDGEGLRLLAELTLVMVLFTDAANADFGVVRRNLGLPEQLLLKGLPLTIVLGFHFAAIVFRSLATLEMELLAANFGSDRRGPREAGRDQSEVPAVMREALNLESGLNDGICVPIVVLLLGLAVGTEIEGGTMAHVARVGAEAIGLGAVIGLGLTWCTTLMLRFAERRGWISEHWVEIPIVALAAACFAAAAGSSPALSVAYCGAGCAAAAQGGAAARRRAHGRCAGAADMGRVRPA